MKEFFDTSVLIASFWGGHPDHPASLKLFAGASKKKSSCGLHTLAEVYAGMTSLPVRQPVSTDQALLFVQEVRQRCTIVMLDENEYCETITQASERGFSSGRIYDALLLRCAAKVKAEIIYTWNLKHFRSIDPSVADRVRTP
jgi:predicted nucleic acid-binding protein